MDIECKISLAVLCKSYSLISCIPPSLLILICEVTIQKVTRAS